MSSLYGNHLATRPATEMDGLKARTWCHQPLGMNSTWRQWWMGGGPNSWMVDGNPHLSRSKNVIEWSKNLLGSSGTFGKWWSTRVLEPRLRAGHHQGPNPPPELPRLHASFWIVCLDRILSLSLYESRYNYNNYIYVASAVSLLY